MPGSGAPPSSQAMVQVCTSSGPASVNEASSAIAEPARWVSPLVGEVIETPGGAFATRTVTGADGEVLSPSLTTRLNVRSPSSRGEKTGVAAVGSLRSAVGD